MLDTVHGPDTEVNQPGGACGGGGGAGVGAGVGGRLHSSQPPCTREESEDHVMLVVGVTPDSGKYVPAYWTPLTHRRSRYGSVAKADAMIGTESVIVMVQA